MRKSFKGMVVAGSAAAVIAAGSGVAYAFVAAAGSGSAAQATVSSNAYSLQVTVSQATDLTPGVAQPVTVTVTNKGPSKVKIGNAVLSLPTSIAGVDPAALATVHLTQPASASTVLDKSATATLTGSIAVDDSPTVDQTSLLGTTITVTAYVS
jgi:hypothetical protein